MQGRLRNVLERSSLFAFAALWLSLTNCSGNAFKGQPEPRGAGGAQAGGGAAAEGTPEAGRAGSESSHDQAGSAGETAGATGAGGTTSSGCNCESGFYCRDATHDCLPCASPERMKFTRPERIATLSDSGHGSRFPRIGATSTDLLYRFEGVGLRYTTDASTSPGVTLSGTEPSDSGPLLIDVDLAGVGGTSHLLFDRLEAGGGRALYTARWNDSLESAERAPAPFNAELDDYSFAVAAHPSAGGPGRAFWMSGRNATAESMVRQLLTAELSAGAIAETVALRIGEAPGCSVSDASPSSGTELDLTPWVTSDGELLLISARRLESDCSASSQKNDLHVLMLVPETGQPAPNATAVPLSDVNGPADETDPSFSADLCDLYFASDRDGRYAVYRARRR